MSSRVLSGLASRSVLARFEDIALDTLNDGGGTFSVETLQPFRNTEGFMVGGVVESEVVLRRAFNGGSIAMFLMQHAEAFALNEDLWLGTWADADGNIHLDASEHFIEYDDAMKVGQLRGEIAIWSIANRGEILVPPLVVLNPLVCNNCGKNDNWHAIRVTVQTQALFLVRENGKVTDSDWDYSEDDDSSWLMRWQCGCGTHADDAQTARLNEITGETISTVAINGEQITQ